MEKELCPFGTVFVRARTERNITQWHVAASAGYHVTNLSKVEKGLYQPGVNLALRLVQALGVDAGIFFETLWLETIHANLEVSQDLETRSCVDFAPFSVEEIRCPFGVLLLQARLETGVSQKIIAEAAAYNLRNMGKVEKGEQEPGVMTALAMVDATGCDVRGFWTKLQAIFSRKLRRDQVKLSGIA